MKYATVYRYLCRIISGSIPRRLVHLQVFRNKKSENQQLRKETEHNAPDQHEENLPGFFH